jgi:predicted Rossmann fold nucleotide-binding protein DprA/Smf involved in DNA uptake
MKVEFGTPVDRAYSSPNKRLREQIYRQHLLFSRIAPQESVYPSNFPERNQLMAALCDAIAIVEAGHFRQPSSGGRLYKIRRMVVHCQECC